MYKLIVRSTNNYCNILIYNVELQCLKVKQDICHEHYSNVDLMFYLFLSSNYLSYLFLKVNLIF